VCQGNFTASSPRGNGGLIHPYGLEINAKGHVFVSNQDTGVVTRYYGSSGDNTRRAQALWTGQSMDPNGDYYPGTLQQFNTGLRGIALDDQERLWVAVEDDNAVHIVSQEGSLLESFEADTPIGVHWDASNKLMWIGDNGDDSVVAVNPVDLSVVTRVTHKKLQHPAGMLAHDGVLYVLSQSPRYLLSVNITSPGDVTVLANLPDDPEHIFLGSC
jgi:outer membrane protein assembly factor BamB